MNWLRRLHPISAQFRIWRSKMCLCVCFPSSAEIWTSQTGSHLIPELNPHEKILSVEIRNGELCLRETKFYTYLHYDAESSAEFLSLHCNDDELLISLDHLVFTGNGDPISAQKVQIGDTLVKVRREDHAVEIVSVTNIQRKTLKGIFAPLTKSGTLLVNGFLVSCYAHVKSHEVAHASLAPLRFWYERTKKWSPQHQIPDTQRSSDGIHKFAKFLISASKALPNAIMGNALTSDLRQLEV